VRPQKRSLTEHRCPLPRKCPLLPGETVADTVATTPKAGHRGAPPRALKPGALRLFRQVHKQQPWHRTEFDIALRRAERKAELEPLLGGLRHPYIAESGLLRGNRFPCQMSWLLVVGRIARRCLPASSMPTSRPCSELWSHPKTQLVAGACPKARNGSNTVAAGAETKRPDTTEVASNLRVAPPGLEPGLS
jgi:hypothetical protein